jgi:hypothetical protein
MKIHKPNNNLLRHRGDEDDEKKKRRRMRGHPSNIFMVPRAYHVLVMMVLKWKND